MQVCWELDSASKNSACPAGIHSHCMRNRFNNKHALSSGWSRWEFLRPVRTFCNWHPYKVAFRDFLPMRVPQLLLKQTPEEQYHSFPSELLSRTTGVTLTTMHMEPRCCRKQNCSQCFHLCILEFIMQVSSEMEHLCKAGANLSQIDAKKQKCS